MKITVGKMLYANVGRVSLVDGLEANAPYCQLTGDRQVVIDVECFEAGLKEGQFNHPPELRKVADESRLKAPATSTSIAERIWRGALNPPDGDLPNLRKGGNQQGVL